MQPVGVEVVRNTKNAMQLTKANRGLTQHVTQLLLAKKSHSGVNNACEKTSDDSKPSAC